MSYSRWSATIGFDFDLAFPGLDIFDQLNAFYSVTAERRMCLLQSQRAFFSDWYVYWDARAIEGGARPQGPGTRHLWTLQLEPLPVLQLRRPQVRGHARTLARD